LAATGAVTGALFVTGCADCERLVMMLREYSVPELTALTSIPVPGQLKRERMVWPRAVSRAPIPGTVPTPIAEDYLEACNVLPESAKASAALSRRCLQNLLVEKGGAKKKDLADQIDEVVNSGTLPSHLADDLHAVRVVGNFGAHPVKSKSTGEIVPVEPGEAEWNLDVVEALFDWYYVEPEKRKKRRDDLNVKLKDAGKPPLR